MDEKTFELPASDEIIDTSGYVESVDDCFSNVPDVAEPLIGNAKWCQRKYIK